MEKYEILKSDEEKFIIINFENLFKPTDIQYSIDETVNDELKKSLNPIIDVEYVRYKPEGSFTLTPQFLLNNNYSSSYVNANFPIEEHLTSSAFKNTLFINEYYDSNDTNKNILLSKNTLKVDEYKTYIINNKEVSANINFTNNFKTEFGFVYVPKFFVDKNIDKIYLKLNFFNSKNGSKTSFTFNDNQNNQSFYHQINLNNTNYTWNMLNNSPKQYINAFINNKIKEENMFNQEVGEETRKNNIILSTGEILTLKNNGVNGSTSFDVPDDVVTPIITTPPIIIDDNISIDDTLMLGYQNKLHGFIGNNDYITFSYNSTKTDLYRPFFYYDYIPYSSYFTVEELKKQKKERVYRIGELTTLSANTWNNLFVETDIENSNSSISYVNYGFGLINDKSVINVQLLPDKQNTQYYYDSVLGKINRQIVDLQDKNKFIEINYGIEQIISIDKMFVVDKKSQTLPANRNYGAAPLISLKQLRFDDFKNKNMLQVNDVYEKFDIIPGTNVYGKFSELHIDFTPLVGDTYVPYVVVNSIIGSNPFGLNPNREKDFTISNSAFIEANKKYRFIINFNFISKNNFYDEIVYVGIINKKSVAILSDNLPSEDYPYEPNKVKPINEFLANENYINKETVYLKTLNDVYTISPNKINNIREIHNPYAKISFKVSDYV